MDYEPHASVAVDEQVIDYHKDLANSINADNFSGVVVTDGELSHIAFDGSATQETLSTLEDEIGTSLSERIP